MNLTKPMTIAALSAILLASTATDADAQHVRVDAEYGPVRTRIEADHHRNHRIDHCHTRRCKQRVTPGRYVLRPQRVYRPGRFVTRTRTVQVPGRWQVTYRNVQVPGYYKTVARRVTTPGHWEVRTRRRGHVRAVVDVGPARVRFDRGRRTYRVWVPGCTRIVHEKVWVPARCERRAVRTWIQPCTRTETYKVWQEPCYVTQNVKVYVPGETVWICKRPRRVVKARFRHRSYGRVGVEFGR